MRWKDTESKGITDYIGRSILIILLTHSIMCIIFREFSLRSFVKEFLGQPCMKPVTCDTPETTMLSRDGKHNSVFSSTSVVYLFTHRVKINVIILNIVLHCIGYS